MKRNPRPRADSDSPSTVAARTMAGSNETSDDIDNRGERIIARPDGHHWLSLDGRREFGPFDSYDQALADMQADDEESAAEPGETLQEAELEIGIADWIDPDTGEPAEGQSTPHLQDE